MMLVAVGRGEFQVALDYLPIFWPLIVAFLITKAIDAASYIITYWKEKKEKELVIAKEC
jgi:hypothetical protein